MAWRFELLALVLRKLLTYVCSKNEMVQLVPRYNSFNVLLLFCTVNWYSNEFSEVAFKPLEIHHFLKSTIECDNGMAARAILALQSWITSCKNGLSHFGNLI